MTFSVNSVLVGASRLKLPLVKSFDVSVVEV